LTATTFHKPKNVYETLSSDGLRREKQSEHPSHHEPKGARREKKFLEVVEGCGRNEFEVEVRFEVEERLK
jgi:hypothetical protein